MRKEKILSVKTDVIPIFYDRRIEHGDEDIIVKDKKGNRITLAEHKKLYPYELGNDVQITTETTKRSFTFTIKAGYFWNGADIPPFLWFFVGSKDNPEFKLPSMIHDYMLEFKFLILEETLKDEISIKEYRRISSLVFRQALKNDGTKTIKSNIMSGAVQLFQATLNRREWDRVA